MFRGVRKLQPGDRYYSLYQDIAYNGTSAWSVTFRVGVYSILVAFIAFGVYMLFNSSSVQERLQIKSNFQKNVLACILFFSLVGLVTMITKAALDW